MINLVILDSVVDVVCGRSLIKDQHTVFNICSHVHPLVLNGISQEHMDSLHLEFKGNGNHEFT